MAIISNSILISLVAGRWHLVVSLFLAFGLVFLRQPMVGQAEGWNGQLEQDNILPALELVAQFADSNSEMARIYDRNGNQLSWHSHFAMAVLLEVEKLLGGGALFRDGLAIHSTLDPDTQTLAEATIAAYRPGIEAGGANNAAMVVLDPVNGEVLALVGSVAFDDESIHGQVNMALVPRQPGSTIIPLIYLAAMEKGWTPATLIWDVPTAFPDGANPPYEPKNFDDRFRGPLTMRYAMGNSYNIPAVKALEYVGVCNFIARARQIGITSLEDTGCQELGQPRQYGLALALGGGEISPLEMAASYAMLANQGRYQEPFTISRIEDNAGNIRYEREAVSPRQVARAEHAYLLSDILSENNARVAAFGVTNNLTIPGHQVAVKTGTSGTTRFDVRDGWTIGYTPQIVTAVWIGNTNNQPIGEGQSGYRVASPIWNRFMSQYLEGLTAVDFGRPSGVIDAEICLDSGVRSGPNCPDRRRVERFAGDQQPLPHEDHFLVRVAVDLWTNLQANQHCTESVYEASFFQLLVNGNEDVLAREYSLAQHWLEETDAGQAWASGHSIAIPLQLLPEDACKEGTPRPQITITEPQAGDIRAGEINVVGSVNAPGFTGYQVEYGLGDNPSSWRLVHDERRQTPVENDLLATWDTGTASAAGPVTLRVLVFGPDNPYTPDADPASVEARVPVSLFDPEANTFSINWFSIAGFALGLAVLAISGVLLWRWRSAVPTTVSSGICPQCGIPSPSNARFCKQCGRRLD